ncbi:MAG: TolC family protein, partial [Gammaproteobacteria bacterium]|nr:TolC family protein [Gammaproteobacteria bacterium]
MNKSVITLFAIISLIGSGQVRAENLLDIYRLALESDPQLQAAEAGHLAALEVKSQSRAALLPNINLSASQNSTDNKLTQSNLGSPLGEESYESNRYTLSLTQTLYRHESFLQLSKASAIAEQANTEFSAANQALLLRVAEAYFNLLAAHSNEEFAEAEKRAIEQQLHQTEQRFEVGLIAITDVHE